MAIYKSRYSGIMYLTLCSLFFTAGCAKVMYFDEDSDTSNKCFTDASGDSADTDSGEHDSSTEEDTSTDKTDTETEEWDWRCNNGGVLCQTEAGPQCADLTSDENHCGECNAPCETGTNCINGTCGACVQIDYVAGDVYDVGWPWWSRDPINMPAPPLVVDFDEDGHMDIIVANSGESTLTLLHGNGDGTFEYWPSVQTCLNPIGVKAANMDSDNFLDLVVVCQGEWVIHIAQSPGVYYEGFLPSHSLGVDTTKLAAVAFVLEDVGGDSFPEVVMLASSIVDYEGYPATTENKAVLVVLDPLDLYSSTVDATLVYEAPSRRAFLSSGDYDNDGKREISLVTNDGLLFFEIADEGGLTAPAEDEYNPVSCNIPLAVTDINGDGNIDVLCGSSRSSTFSVHSMLGDGGTPIGFTEGQSREVGYNDVNVSLADFNNDGFLDLAAHMNGNYICTGDSNGNFAKACTYLPVPTDNQGVTFADIDEDGILDQLALHYEYNPGGRLTVLHGGDNLTFTSDLYEDVTAPSIRDADVANYEDMDRPLIVALRRWYDSETSTKWLAIVSASMGDDGKYTVYQELQTSLYIDSEMYTKEKFSFLHDVNGDARPDLIFGTNTGVYVADYAGNGTFNTPYRISTSFEARSVSIGDFNGDGRVDVGAYSYAISVGKYSVHLISRMAGQDDWSTQTIVGYYSWRPRQLLGDFNGDGFDDFFYEWNGYLSSSEPAMRLAPGNTEGSLGTPIDLLADGGSLILNAGVGDVNGDGRDELVNIKGAYTFSKAQKFELINQVDETTSFGNAFVTDYNLDGHMDALFGDKYYGTLTRLQGNGDGSFEVQESLSVFDAGDLILANKDVNGDGIPDILLTNSSAAKLILLKGTPVSCD